MTGFADDPTLDLITAETDRLRETVHQLDDDGVRRPSLCPGWTRAHVITHVARNADGLRDVLRAATNGTEGTMYESQARRDADIEAGAGRSAAVLEADLEISDDELLAALADATPEALERRVTRLRVADQESEQTSIPVRKVPAMRLREVVLHHVDLDAGFTLADAPEAFVLAELAHHAQVRFRGEAPFVLDAGPAGRWQYGKQPDGGTTDVVTVSGSPAELLGWLSGRADGAGLDSSSGSLPQLPVWG
jgi:maleylpyruvate isomerase